MNKFIQSEVKSKSIDSVNKKTKPQLMEEFCKSMKLLAGDLKRRFPNDVTANTINRKISVAVDHAPERILRAVGKYLVKYNEEILSANYDFFLKSTFDDDFPKDREMDEKERLCMYTIELVKKHWNNLNDGEKESYHNIVKELLFCYCDFMTLESKFDAKKSS